MLFGFSDLSFFNWMRYAFVSCLVLLRTSLKHCCPQVLLIVFNTLSFGAPPPNLRLKNGIHNVAIHFNYMLRSGNYAHFQ